MRKILDLTEMPPVYIPKRRSNLKYAFQEMALTLRSQKTFERGITRGDTMIFNKNFFDRKLFKTGPRCAEGSIW